VEPKQGPVVGECSLLPLIEIKDDNNAIISGDKKVLRLPPLILMQLRKFTADTQAFNVPQGKLLKADEEKKE
jgi:hypothetical protein